MEDDQTNVWAETGPVVTARLAPCTTSSLALPTNVEPSTDADRSRFADAMGACLALVAPTGMGQVERRVWMEAAFVALRHLPIDVIEKGAGEARKIADHPSKVVPAIVAAAEPEMAWRRRQRAPRPDSSPALPAPGDERATESELDEICRRYGVGRYAKEQSAAAMRQSDPTSAPIARDRPCREPDDEFYRVTFGIDVAEQRVREEADRVADELVTDDAVRRAA